VKWGWLRESVQWRLEWWESLSTGWVTGKPTEPAKQIVIVPSNTTTSITTRFGLKRKQSDHHTSTFNKAQRSANCPCWMWPQVYMKLQRHRPASNVLAGDVSKLWVRASSVSRKFSETVEIRFVFV